MKQSTRDELRSTLDTIRDEGLFKGERQIAGAQGRSVDLGERSVLNFCANNYLGFADDPRIVQAAREALDTWGFGMASVRFICGTQTQHVELERRIAAFVGTEAAILYPSCFDANGGLFEVLLDDQDVVISDELNHASIIDGIRLCKAGRLRYRNRDLADLERQLVAARDARRRLVVTDGVFSMDGYLAPLDGICELADEYDALVMVDDSHAVGFIGPHGAGTPELFGVQDRVDIVTGTLGKALGGASGGYVAGARELVELLRQRSRPYLFSNTVAPPVVAACLAALDLVAGGAEERARLARSTARFRGLMTDAGFDVLEGDHPIVPVMFGDARTAVSVAESMLELGVYVVAFSYPVVPRERARIRVQISAAHTDDDIDRCVAAFVESRQRVTGA